MNIDASSGETTTKSAVETHPLVQMDFYGESMCPDCRHMVLDVLDPLFKNGVSKLFNLRYVAYGNVQGDPSVKGEEISCQHGPKECLYNRYINCVQDMLGHDQDKWFPYVSCMAENMRELDDRAPDCAAAVGLKADDVAACARGPDGDRFELEAGVETGSLEPKHKFVPWVGWLSIINDRCLVVFS
jgi:interferon gamma-inducible protein 30